MAPWPAGGVPEHRGRGRVKTKLEIPQTVETETLKSHRLFSLPPSVIWNGRVTVSVVDIDGSVAAVVQLEHVAVAVLPPPGAQLSVPAARQRVKELWVLHADHGEEVLVAQVAPEAILVGQFGHVVGLQQLVVQRRRPHGAEVQQHHAAVEAREAVGMGLSHFGVRVLFTVLPESVSDGRGKQRTTVKLKKKHKNDRVKSPETPLNS